MPKYLPAEVGPSQNVTAPLKQGTVSHSPLLVLSAACVVGFIVLLASIFVSAAIPSVLNSSIFGG